eukprot:g36989.t1
MPYSGWMKGSGVRYLINTTWCLDLETLESHWSPDLEYLPVKRRPYYLPREFTSAILTAVYIPPPCGCEECPRCDLHRHKHSRDKFPEALFIVASDFKQ